MLNNKDYCDYETCVALKELGYPTKMTFVNEFGSIEIPINSGLISLYEAQKWLREEKGMLVDSMVFADNSIDADGKVVDRWIYYSCAILNTLTAEFIRSYDHSDEYDSYEEALSEGIKEAVKFLKEK